MQVRPILWGTNGLSTVGTPEATKVRYVIDSKGSTFVIRAYATGLLSSFGHNPTIAIQDFQGEVQFTSEALDDASVRIVIQSASLTVTDDISSKDRQEIERRMHDSQCKRDHRDKRFAAINRAIYTPAPLLRIIG